MLQMSHDAPSMRIAAQTIDAAGQLQLARAPPGDMPKRRRNARLNELSDR